MSHPQSVTFLSLSHDFTARNLDEFVNLKVLECNFFENLHHSRVLPFVTGKVGQLEELRCNTGGLPTTFYGPREDQLKSLQIFHLNLKTFVAIRPGLSIYFNGVCLDLDSLQFDDYQFDDSLISTHLHNLQENDLYVKPCEMVVKTDYLDLNDLFSPDFQFGLFAKLYPNVCHVTVFMDWECQIDIEESSLLSFFAVCRGISKLEFDYCNFSFDFYDQLSQMPSCRLLRSLDIFESPFSMRPEESVIDFHGFLVNFKNLKYFHTNAAPKEQMLEMIRSMRINPPMFYIFSFINDQEQATGTKPFWQFVIGRTSVGIGSMAIASRIVTDVHDIDWANLKFMSSDWQALLGYFSDPANESKTPHWVVLLIED